MGGHVQEQPLAYRQVEACSGTLHNKSLKILIYTYMEEVTEFKKEIITEGTGEVAKAGDTVEVHYTGTLRDGSTFDSSRDRGTPFSFPLGAGMVIKGWDQGVAGMRVGEKAKLTIPPSLGYGERGYPPVIPANATLVFEVELLSIR